MVRLVGEAWSLVTLVRLVRAGAGPVRTLITRTLVRLAGEARPLITLVRLIRAGVGPVRTLVTRALVTRALVARALVTRGLVTGGLVTLSRVIRIGSLIAWARLLARLPLLHGAALRTAAQHVEELSDCAHVGATAALRADRLPRPVIHALIVPFARRRG